MLSAPTDDKKQRKKDGFPGGKSVLRMALLSWLRQDWILRRRERGIIRTATSWLLAWFSISGTVIHFNDSENAAVKVTREWWSISCILWRKKKKDETKWNWTQGRLFTSRANAGQLQQTSDSKIEASGSAVEWFGVWFTQLPLLKTEENGVNVEVFSDGRQVAHLDSPYHSLTISIQLGEIP